MRAQLLEDLPEEMQDVGIDEKLGDQVPLDLEFLDENGKRISMQGVFDGERPVLLSLNYSDCPMLCRIQLDGLVRCLRDLEWTTGQQFDVVSVSVDPLETPIRAKQTEQRYLADYGRAGAASGWRFLVGSKKNIKKLADSVGFRYKLVPETGEYSHTAALMVMTPGGVVSRYLYGVMYEPQTVRLSLVEAGEGKIGSTLDRIILFCFHYDETKGRYGPVARRVMSMGAGVTVVALVAGLTPFWLRRSKQDDDEESPAADGEAATHDAAETSSEEADVEDRTPVAVG